MDSNLTIPINSLFLSFESFKFGEILFDTLARPSHFLLSLGQLYTITLRPTIETFGINADNTPNYVLDLNLQLEQFPIEESNTTQFKIYSYSNLCVARYEKTKQYDGKYVRLCLIMFKKILKLFNSSIEFYQLRILYLVLEVFMVL